MYKDIVVCVGEMDGRENTIRAAARLANEVNARLTGLYVRIEDIPAIPPYGMVSDQIIKEAIERSDERAASAKKIFDEITFELECDVHWLELFERDHPVNAIFYADLVISSQLAYGSGQARNNRWFINNLILETGKPVILLPNAWNEPTFGSRIVVGWDESREAARAIQDALPLLQKAQQVEVVHVNKRGEDGNTNISQISTYLTRRNVSNSFKLETTNEQFNTAAKVLLNHVEKNSADLLVVGGYGHTRLREIILGGVTRYLSKHSNVPVLLSH